MANNINIEHYTPTKQDKFFFDANVWIALLIPALSHNQSIETKYAYFLSKIRSREATILTSFVVVSEVVNRYLRYKLGKYNEKNNTNLDYKNFKQKPDYKNEFEYITKLVRKKILKMSTSISDGFDCLNGDDLIYNYSAGCDLNDNYILSLANVSSCHIVSRDKYLCNSTININVFSDY